MSTALFRAAQRSAGSIGMVCALLLSRAHAQQPAPPRLADLSLEQLRDVVVTTVSRVEERLDSVAAAVYIISAEDIRRAGVTTLPEALRLAPALSVARADANQYAISARGFANVLANKMLVLVDGRTVYTPLFSGVFWEAQDVLLEDVERIEVVTGPSTALWGSNAVNGLIHVITRSAAETHGSFAMLHAGDAERGAAARHGFALGERGALRGYIKSYDRSNTSLASGALLSDAAEGVQAGLRADWALAGDELTVQADAYRGEVDQGRRFSGANLTGRWLRSEGSGRGSSVQLYADHVEREQPGFVEKLDTVDLVGQVAFAPSDAQRVVVGGGYRRARDRLALGPAFAFVPATRSLAWSRLFAQDQLALSPRLALTLAASLERNPFSGTELLPSVRLAWQPAVGPLLWTSLSRAARAPSRIDREFFQPAQPPHLLAGGPDFRSELSDVLELGGRGQARAGLSYSLTLFHHQHRRLRSLAPGPQGLQFENGIEGRTRGLEAWLRWQPHARWRLDAGLVQQQQRLRVAPGAVDLGGMASLGNDPRHHASLRSWLDLGSRWSWDLAVRRVGALPAPVVPSYTAVDTRLAWLARPGVELALGIDNLFDARHPEWGVPTNRVEHERSVWLQWRWRR